MDWPPFYRTAMGRDFLERTVPELVEQIKRLNAILERLADQQTPSDKGK